MKYKKFKKRVFKKRAFKKKGKKLYVKVSRGGIML